MSKRMVSLHLLESQDVSLADIGIIKSLKHLRLKHTKINKLVFNETDEDCAQYFILQNINSISIFSNKFNLLNIKKRADELFFSKLMPYVLISSCLKDKFFELYIYKNGKILAQIIVRKNEENGKNNFLLLDDNNLFGMLLGLTQNVATKLFNEIDIFQTCLNYVDFTGLPLNLSFDEIAENQTKYHAIFESYNIESLDMYQGETYASIHILDGTPKDILEAFSPKFGYKCFLQKKENVDIIWSDNSFTNKRKNNVYEIFGVQNKNIYSIYAQSLTLRTLKDDTKDLSKRMSGKVILSVGMYNDASLGAFLAKDGSVVAQIMHSDYKTNRNFIFENKWDNVQLFEKYFEVPERKLKDTIYEYDLGYTGCVWSDLFGFPLNLPYSHVMLLKKDVDCFFVGETEK